MSYLSWHWRMMQKFKESLSCDFKYDMKNLVNFYPPYHLKVKKFHFDGLFLSKVYEVWAKKKYRSHLSWHWTVMQIWINPDLVVSKMAWGIGWTFTKALKSLKNFTLMGSFCPKHNYVSVGNFRGNLCHDTEGWCKI